MNKYTQENLLPVLRLFIDARNRAIAAGFTDNGGAIHSVERILDILSQRVCYPGVSHINSLKKSPSPAEFSEAANAVRDQIDQLYIEHVQPQRAYAQKIIERVGAGDTDKQILDFIRTNYRIVILTKAEAGILNRKNRSRISPDRLAEAEISIFSMASTKPPLSGK